MDKALLWATVVSSNAAEGSSTRSITSPFAARLSSKQVEALRVGSEDVISACASSGDLDGALTLFHKMRARGMRLDDSTLHPFFHWPYSPGSAGDDEGGDEGKGQTSVSPDSFAPWRSRASPRVFGDFDRHRMRAAWRRRGARRGRPGTGFRESARNGKEIRVPDSSGEEESPWKNLPVELIVRLVLDAQDSQTILSAAGVCTSWRDALTQGITELSLSWCGRGVSQLVQSVVRKFQRLQVLNMRRCTALEDAAVLAIAKYCPDMRALDLSCGTRLTDTSLQGLARSCHSLQIVDLSGCVRMSEVGMVALVRGCQGLRMVNICGCDRAGTDSVLQALGQYCTGLQSLNVGWCERITDAGVIAVATGCRGLQVVDLCGCLYITDKSVSAVAEMCPDLYALGLHCCRLITDASIHALVAIRHRLSSDAIAKENKTRSRILEHHAMEHHLPLSWQSLISSGSTTGSILGTSRPGGGAVERCRGLVSLNLSGCIALRAPAVQALCDAFPALHTCPSQRSLNISGCVHLTNVHCRCIGAERASGLDVDGTLGPVDPRNRPL